MSNINSEALDRMKYFFMKTDGTYEFPNSLEGDLLKICKREIEAKNSSDNDKKQQSLERAKYLLESLDTYRKSINDHSYNHAEVCMLIGHPSKMGLPQFDDLNRICRDLIQSLESD